MIFIYDSLYILACSFKCYVLLREAIDRMPFSRASISFNQSYAGTLHSLHHKSSWTSQNYSSADNIRMLHWAFPTSSLWKRSFILLISNLGHRPRRYTTPHSSKVTRLDEEIVATWYQHTNICFVNMFESEQHTAGLRFNIHNLS